MFLNENKINVNIFLGINMVYVYVPHDDGIKASGIMLYSILPSFPNHESAPKKCKGLRCVAVVEKRIEK